MQERFVERDDVKRRIWAPYSCNCYAHPDWGFFDNMRIPAVCQDYDVSETGNCADCGHDEDCHVEEA